MSKDNTNKAMVSILISTEEATEITNFTASDRQWSDNVYAHKVECSVSDNTQNILSRTTRVWELIYTDHMAESNKGVILDTRDEFHDLFYLEGYKVSHTDLVKHSISTLALDENSN